MYIFSKASIGVIIITMKFIVAIATNKKKWDAYTHSLD